MALCKPVLNSAGYYTCKECGFTSPVKLRNPFIRNCVEKSKILSASGNVGDPTIESLMLRKPPPPQELMNSHGPGTELWKILHSLGVKNKEGCSCSLLADSMNSLGPEGCRKNKDSIIKLMKKNQERYGWKDFVKAGVMAIKTGWVVRLNPLDPIPGLLEEAIRRAEEHHA